MPPHITISIQFDAELQKLTGKEGHPVFMSEGANFMFLLMSVFEEYPEIQNKYPPGAIGFTINGTPPKLYSPLFDNDVVYFAVSIAN